MVVLACTLFPAATTAWPYADCSGSGDHPVYDLDTVTAHFDSSNKIIELTIQGTFSNVYQYPAAETSQWRAMVTAEILNTQLHMTEGPACSIITGGCPVASGPTTISTNFTIDQTAPFAELMIFLQIQSANSQMIVCTGVLLEQSMDNVNTIVSYLPLAVALYSGAVSLASIILRATTGNGFIGALATYGLASTSDIISVHTPGLFDIIFYTQFMVMTGQLSINYPSFYVTFTSLFHWSFLEFRKSFAGDGPANSTYVLSYGGAGSVNQINGPRNSRGSNLRKRLLSEPWRVESSPLLTVPTGPGFFIDGLPSATPSAYSSSHLFVSTDTSSTSSSGSTTSSTSSTTSTKSKPRTTTPTLPSGPSSIAPPPPTSTTPPLPVVPNVTDPFTHKNVTFVQYNVSKYGMEAYAAAFGANPSSLFLCTLINTIMAGGASLFISAFLLVIAWLIAKESHQKGKTLQHAFNFVAGNLIRVWSLFYTPLALSAMYQLTIPGSTVMIVIASVSLLIFSVGVTILITWRVLRASALFLLFEDQGTLLKFGALYNTLAEEGFKWPFSESGDNKFHLLLGFVRIIVTGCSVAYLDDLDTPAKIRQCFGYIQMALHLAVFIVMFALVLWNTIQVVLFWQSRHKSSWTGPTKTYSLEDPSEVNGDWTLSNRPLSRIPEPAQVVPIQSRRYTVQPYSSIGDLNALSEDNLIGRHSMYQQSHQPSGYRRSVFLSNGAPHTALNLRSEAVVPLSSSPEPMSVQSATSLPRSPSIDSVDGPAIPLQPTQLSSIRFQTPRESYAKIQRMTHQQATPDLRTRRMSEIFRDGGYLYEPKETINPTPTKAPEEKQSMIKSIKGSFGGLLSFSKRTKKNPTGDGSKPKAFEVIRPQRPSTVMETTDDISQAGDDNLRELNSLGISRFFEESGLNNKRERSLFVANPETMISRTGSVRSSASGFPQAPPELIRQTSTATSVHTVSRQRSKPALNMSADLSSIYSGVGSLASEPANMESKRVSATSAQYTYPRTSAESNITDVLRSDTPFKFQGGETIKVSKGPEKAVQYWSKKSGQYVESTSDPLSERKQTTVLPLVSPPLLLLPTTRGSFFDTIQIDTSKAAATAQLTKSRPGSRPESPTESHHSGNVAASAGKMHEILDRMFSDQDDDDSDTISDGDETCSTFSGRVSATIMALQQKQEQEEYFADAQSLYRSETLEPVLEHLDSEADVAGEAGGGGNGNDGRSGSRKIPYKPTRTASGTLIRTYSGSPKLASASSSSAILSRSSKSGSLSRPLAQTPLHSPSMLSFTGSATSLLLPGTLSRHSSRTSLGEGFVMTKQEHDVNATQQVEARDTKVLDPLREEPVTTSKTYTNSETPS
ncbi:hypothetical protein BGX26_011655 [Mortierella sp. AD094]|nr:hypothetical protein BGX26_011655 [Mortierella sp. AD094]